MAIRIQKNALYQSTRRWHRDWEAFDDAGVMLTRGRANFPKEPTKAEEDEKFAVIKASIEAQVTEAAAVGIYEAQKQAYMAKEGLGSEDDLVRACVENDIDTSALIGGTH